MFLQDLIEDEKAAFLELAHQVAQADGILSEAEDALIAAFAREMDIPAHALVPSGERAEKDIGELTAVFRSETSRKIAFMELLALTLSDNDYSPEEKTLLNKIRIGFGFDETHNEKCKAWVRKINEVYREGRTLVYG